jgi:zinc transporter ZupT
VESFTPHPSSEEHDHEHATNTAAGQNGQYQPAPSSRCSTPIEALSPEDHRLPPLRSQGSYLSSGMNGGMGDARQSTERMNSSTTLFPKTRPPYDARPSGRSRRGSNLEAGAEDDDDDEDGEGKDDQGLSGLNATLGLVIHAMADGIALGASSLSTSGGLGFVVFLAVIVHKGESQQRRGVNPRLEFEGGI